MLLGAATFGFGTGENGEGKALCFHGSASGLAATPSWTVESNQVGAYLAWTGAPLGDVDGDGYDDVIVAAPWYDAGEVDEGRAWIYAGSPTGLGTTPVWDVESNQAGAHYGTGVAGAGDVNGDGLPDVLVGAGDYDNGEADEGRAFLYLGGGAGGPVAFCTAGTSASGCQAQVSGVGIASATAASGFVLMASSAEGAKDGLFFFGTNGRQANPWGNGTSYQCVVPPVTRAGLLTGIGTSGLCDGSFSQDLNALWCPACPKPAKNPGAGSVAQAQLWYRDPQNTSNQTTSLSDALEFVVGP